jgi:hypothetical protein
LGNRANSISGAALAAAGRTLRRKVAKPSALFAEPLDVVVDALSSPFYKRRMIGVWKASMITSFSRGVTVAGARNMRVR